MKFSMEAKLNISFYFYRLLGSHMSPTTLSRERKRNKKN